MNLKVIRRQFVSESEAQLFMGSYLNDRGLATKGVKEVSIQMPDKPADKYTVTVTLR